MKALVLKIFPLFMFLLLLTSYISAQHCGRTSECAFEIDDNYDYRGQSTYATLWPGDTVRTKIVVYGGQMYNIFTCAEPQVGTIEFNIIKQYKKYRKVVDEIIESEETIYKTDEYGDYVYNDYGEYIVEDVETVYDTIWSRERYVEEDYIFNSINNDDGVPYWKKSAQKTQTLIVEVIVPDNASEGCVDLFIGHRSRSRSKFR